MIALASFIYCWKSIIPDYQKNQEALAKTNKEIELSKAKLESLQNTKNSLAQLGDIVDRLFISVPADKDTPNLITELEAIATKSETVIPSIQISEAAPSKDTKAPAKNAISVSFSVNGTYENLNKMITALEKDIRFTNIKSLTYSVTPDAKTTSLALQLEVYKRDASVIVSTSSTSASATAQSGAGAQK
jgi:Tfp pilus assembly protein PilO